MVDGASVGTVASSLETSGACGTSKLAGPPLIGLQPRSPTRNAVVTDALPQHLPLEEVKRVARSLRLLSLFGGPDRSDGIDKFVRELGAQIDVFDT